MTNTSRKTNCMSPAAALQALLLFSARDLLFSHMYIARPLPFSCSVVHAAFSKGPPADERVVNEHVWDGLLPLYVT